MFSQGSFNPQSGQGPQAPRPPPFLQHPSSLPALYHNFQQGPLLPSPQLPPHLHQPGLPMYQHSPLAPHFAARQVPPGGMPNTGQPYLRPPPTVHGSAPLSHMYSTAQEKLQHSPYMASGPLPQPPPGSHNAEMLQAPIPPRSLPPAPSQGSLYRAPLHHLPQQPGSVQGLHQIPPPPPPPSASNFSHSAKYGSPLELMDGTSQISSMAPPPPPLPASPSPPPIPPCLPPPISSSGSVSMPLPAGSLFLKGGCGSEIDNIGEDGLSSKSNVTSVNPPPPPKPTEDKIIQKIDELCQLIAKNGSYEDMVRQKESKNPEFNFLFGGEPGSEAAIAHDYFLWIKQQYLLASKLDGIVPAMPTNHLAVAIEPNASADSDMEMEDDITGSEMDQAVNEPIEGREQRTDSVSNSFDAKKQLHTLSRSTTANAATVVLSDKEFLSGPSRLDEQGSKLVSSLGDEESGRLGFGNQGQVIISAGDTEFPLPSYKESYSKPVAGVESLSRAAAAECITSDKYSSEAMKGSSPFRLLQDYASNDSSENDKDPCLEDANPETVSPLVAGSDDNLHRDTGLNLKMVSGCNSPYETEKGIGLLPESGMSRRSLKFFSDSQKEAKETVPPSNASGSASEQIDTKHENRSSFDQAASPKALSKEDASGCEDIESKKTQLPSNAQKIDKFGRLFREGASDSDSDDSPHAQRRHKKGRSRSQSRSRSPLGRRRNRRSPRRRREKRSRSRSWSPRNRRSRSRSPSFRHAGDFSSSNMRRDKGQMRECFDFLRGKCYRGASCRYMHHGSEKSGGSRHHRSKQQYVQIPPSSKNYNTHDDKLSRKASFDEQETMNQDVQHNHGISVIHATKDDTTFHNKGDSISITLVDSENHREGAIKVPETKVVQEKYLDDIHCVRGNFQEALDSDWVAANSFPSKILSDASILKSHGEASKDVHPSLKDSVIQQSQLILSDPVLENADHPVQETDDSSVSDSSPNQTFATSPKKLHDAVDSVHNSSQLPPFSGPNKESNTAPQMTQLKRDNNLIPQTASFQSHSAPLESFPSYMLPNQSSLFSVLPSVSLPPPPPLVRPHVPILNVGTAQTGVDLQFQQGGLPPRSDFGSQMFRPYSTELSSNSQVGDFRHRAYAGLHESHQPLLHAESGLKPLPGSNPSDSKFGGMCLLGEDRVKQLPVQGLSASDAFARSSNYPQPASLQESPAGKVQSFPVDSVPPREIPSSSQIHPYLQQKQLPYDLHHSVHNSVYGMHGSRYPADLQDGNQPLHLPDFGVTRSSTHFNPYASTFEKPLSSRFSSDFFKPEKDTAYSNKHEQPSSLSHLSVDEPGVGSKKSISSPRSARGVGRVILRSDNDQYDPLFDSIEPSSNSYKKSDHMKKWETPNNSDIMLRLKGSNQPFYVEENSKKKEVGGITLATSTDNEEFGETADAEVGDVENASQSNADALANTNMGEIEIDQIKSPGKSKKSKESRSMKLFKVCLAEFVKEVLKPSWRQGNMSKETFKTVVKKTVDKVSGAMESHHIPKSKAKINQYIDSSQRKLTKLVMGYVDKYAKG